jgi:Rrf2 family nitric oxide-sensitive transcriptional repressor
VPRRYGISRSHLTKIVQELSAQGLLGDHAGTGRRHAPDEAVPARSTLGAVVRLTETDFHLVDRHAP